jgi:hypothetical protein
MAYQDDLPPEGVRLKRPKKYYVRRAVKSLILPVTVLAIGGMGSSVHSTYARCISAEQSIWASYLSYSPAIYSRILNISFDIYLSKSISDLRDRIAELPREPAFKDKSLVELEMSYAAVLEQIDLDDSTKYAELYKAVDAELRQQPEYNKLIKVYSGVVPSEFNDSDLPKLQTFAQYVDRFYIDYLFRPFRTVFVEGCTFADVVQLEFGGRPKILRAKLTTFTEVEQHRLERLKANPAPACLPPCVPNL